MSYFTQTLCRLNHSKKLNFVENYFFKRRIIVPSTNTIKMENHQKFNYRYTSEVYTILTRISAAMLI